MVGAYEEEEEIEATATGWEIVEAEPQPPTPPTPSLPFSPQDIYTGIEQLEVQEEEEDDEGPPPGWNIIPPPQSDIENVKMDDVDDDEGPPPGWDIPRPEQLITLENKEMDIERQPPSQHFAPLPHSEYMDDHEHTEEGPPPGWPLMHPLQQNNMIERQEIEEIGTELRSHSVSSPQIRIKSKSKTVDDKKMGIIHDGSYLDPLIPIVVYKQEDNEGAQQELSSIPLPQSQVVPPLQLPLSDKNSTEELADEEGPRPGSNSIVPNQTNIEYQDIKEEASREWMSPEKPKVKLVNEDTIEDGPPPGWNLIEQTKIIGKNQEVKEGASRGWTSPEKLNTELENQDIIEDGPPPGWHSIEQNNTYSEHHDIEDGASREARPPAKPKIELQKHDIMEEDADKDGGPPGWHAIDHNKINSEYQDTIEGASRGWMSPEKPKTELRRHDTIDEGPPPGWNHMSPSQRKTGLENQAIKSNGFLHKSHSCPPQQPNLASVKQDIREERPQPDSNSVCQQLTMGERQQEVKDGSQPGFSSMPPPRPQIRPRMPRITPTSTPSRSPTQSGCQSVSGSKLYHLKDNGMPSDRLLARIAAKNRAGPQSSGGNVELSHDVDPEETPQGNIKKRPLIGDALESSSKRIHLTQQNERNLSAQHSNPVRPILGHPDNKNKAVIVEIEPNAQWTTGLSHPMHALSVFDLPADAESYADDRPVELINRARRRFGRFAAEFVQMSNLFEKFEREESRQKLLEETLSLRNERRQLQSLVEELQRESMNFATAKKEWNEEKVKLANDNQELMQEKSTLATKVTELEVEITNFKEILANKDRELEQVKNDLSEVELEAENALKDGYEICLEKFLCVRPSRATG